MFPTDGRALRGTSLPQTERPAHVRKGKTKPERRTLSFREKTRRGRRRAADISPVPLARSRPVAARLDAGPWGCRQGARFAPGPLGSASFLRPPAAAAPTVAGIPAPRRAAEASSAVRLGARGRVVSRALFPGTLLSCPRSPPPLAAEMTESPVCFLLFNAVARTTVAPFQSLGTVAGGRRRRRSAGLPGRPRPRRFAASPDPARPGPAAPHVAAPGPPAAGPPPLRSSARPLLRRLPGFVYSRY